MTQHDLRARIDADDEDLPVGLVGLNLEIKNSKSSLDSAYDSTSSASGSPASQRKIPELLVAGSEIILNAAKICVNDELEVKPSFSVNFNSVPLKETGLRHSDSSVPLAESFYPEGPSEEDVSTSEPSATTTRKTNGKLFPQVLAALALAIAAMIEGYSAGYTSPALASMTAPNSSIPITEQEASWIGSLMPLNALFGGIFGGSLIDRFGRKRTVMATGIPYIISWLLITFATNLPMIYAGRCIQGFCVGLTTLCLPVYLGETIQPEARGTLGLLPTTIGNTGILLCYVLGWYIDWKVLAALGAILPVPFMLFIYFVPETPRWYISKGRYEEALAALQWLRGSGTDVTDEFVEIEMSYRESCHRKTSLKDLAKPSYLKPLLISLGLMFFQQLSGVNAVIFYTVSIFEKSKSSVNSYLASIIVGLANFFATLGSNIVIDRVGRKVLLNISSLLMGVSLCALGAIFFLQHIDYDVSHLGWFPLVAFMIYIIAFSIGYGPIPWLMMGEVFPSRVRGPAASVATAFNWTCSFAVTKAFTDLTEWIGVHGAFWFFGVVCFTSIIFVVLWVPETKGRSLEDIEKHMMKKKKKKDFESVTECTYL